MKRTSEELQRDVAALIKVSGEVAADAKELVRTAAEITQKASAIRADSKKTQAWAITLTERSGEASHGAERRLRTVGKPA